MNHSLYLVLKLIGLSSQQQVDGVTTVKTLINLQTIPSSPTSCVEYRYHATGWGRCSHYCGSGTQCRQVDCILYVNGVAAERVHKDFCAHFANQSTFPSPLLRPCNEYSCPE